MKTLISIFFISTMIACAVGNSSIQRINVDELLKMGEKENVEVIDVRTPREIAEGYIKGTDKFIDYNGDHFDDQIASLDKSKTFVVYCRSGNRSTKALNKMAKKGFTNLYELKGGIKAVSDETHIQK